MEKLVSLIPGSEWKVCRHGNDSRQFTNAVFWILRQERHGEIFHPTLEAEKTLIADFVDSAPAEYGKVSSSCRWRVGFGVGHDRFDSRQSASTRNRILRRKARNGPHKMVLNTKLNMVADKIGPFDQMYSN